jgi:hypothetical protein
MIGRTFESSPARGRFLLSLLLCPLLLGVMATQASADSRLDFTLSNRLGVTIKEVYMSPHQSKSWEEDVLGRGVLADGAESVLRFSSGQADRADIWDMKIVTSDGRIFYWQSPGFNLTKVREITVYMKGGQAIAESK